MQRAPAVVVGLVDGPRGPSKARVKSRAAVLRFTTHDGREVETVSSLSTYPGPRPGRRLTVDYDPADPEGTAERPGVRRLKLVLCPLIIAGGAALLALAVARL